MFKSIFIISKKGEEHIEQGVLPIEDGIKDISPVASILKVYLIENKKDRLIGYIDYNQNKFWIDEDIVSLIKSKKRRKKFKELIEETNIDELLECGYCADFFFREIVSILIEEGYKVKTEHIGGHFLYSI